jgi:hypothetical protein
VYTDDEIKLIRDLPLTYEEVKPVKGTVSFDESYNTVTIDIQVLKDGRLAPFAGNGKYRINEND